MRLTQSRTSASRALAAVTLCSILVVAATAAAQSLASVQGFVSDETGAFLPGVTVELVDIERGQRRTAVTNREGFFALRAVPSGVYDLVASLAGFRTTHRENVRLLVGQSLDVDLRLGLASVEETVVDADTTMQSLRSSRSCWRDTCRTTTGPPHPRRPRQLLAPRQAQLGLRVAF